jgi:hypothetical protein
MTRIVNFVAELFSLEAELKDLEQAQEELPYGAHIHALFQVAIERVHEQIVTLLRLRAVADRQLVSG